MARSLRDSYTGEVVSDYYTSAITGINEPKDLYREKVWGSSASYRADKQEDGSFSITRCAQAARELPAYPLCSVADERWAHRILDWLVIHDALMLNAIEQMDKNFDLDTFFMCVEQAMQETITS